MNRVGEKQQVPPLRFVTVGSLRLLGVVCGRKAPEKTSDNPHRRGPSATLGQALRLRAIKALVCDRSAKRFARCVSDKSVEALRSRMTIAQDDDMWEPRMRAPEGRPQIPRLPRISCREFGFGQLHVVLFKENHISGSHG